MNWFCNGLIWTISMGFGHSLPAYCHDYNGFEQTHPGIRIGDSPVMLSAAKHLAAQRDRPFAALRVTIGGTSRHAQVDLSPDGRMLVQYVNQAGDFSDRAFTLPSLTHIGSAANS